LGITSTVLFSVSSTADGHLEQVELARLEDKDLQIQDLGKGNNQGTCAWFTPYATFTGSKRKTTHLVR